MVVDSLEDHGVYLRPEKTLASLLDCPASLKEFFSLILSVEKLEWDFFGGTLTQERSLQPTPVMQYESELKLQADELNRVCLDLKRADDIEEGWVDAMKPIVFYRFSRENEEVYHRARHHHCAICGKHFSLRSRPFLNINGQRSYERYLKGVHDADTDSENSDVCKVHLNISNFDATKLTFLAYDNEKTKIPDLTIGLLAWTKDAWHAPRDMTDDELDSILEHDLVRPFRHDILQKLECKDYIKPIFAFPKPRKGNHAGRVRSPSTTFPFAIWEAKRATGCDPVAQNALKSKLILDWQEDIATRAKIAWEPLMFHFTSVGSTWKVYACHIQRLGMRRRKVYQFRLLWSGDCVDETKALQLLYLVDIIALWGEWQYKPFAGASIRIFEKRSEGLFIRNLLTTNLLQYQKKITTRNFRSLQTQLCPKNSDRVITSIKRAGTNTSISEVNEQLVRGLRLLSLEHYYIPEKDGFIWLLYRQLIGQDLVVVRVNNAGVVLQPMVIFDSTNWRSEDFRRVAYEERARIPANVVVDFRYDEDGKSVLQKCFDPEKGYCTMSELQFCAILPLKRMSRYNYYFPTHIFQALERLLGLRTLINAAEDAMRLWCICEEEEHDNMILCDYTKCAIGWYHKACVDLEEDYKAKDWVCSTCKRTSQGKDPFSKYDNETYEEDILEASDVRIQRARSLGRVWRNHRWPSPRDVTNLMYRQIACEIEMDSRPHMTVGTVEQLEVDRYFSVPQCRAVLRNTPQFSADVRHRFRSMGIRP